LFLIRKQELKGWDVSKHLDFIEKWFTGENLKRFTKLVNGKSVFRD